MKKYLLLLLIPFIFAASIQDMHKSVIARKSSSLARPADLLFYINGEGSWSTPTYTVGASEYSAGDQTGTASNDADVTVDALKYGSYGFDFPDGDSLGDDFFNFTISSNNIVSGAKGRIGFWLQVNALTNGAAILYVGDADSSHYLSINMLDAIASVDLRLRGDWGGGAINTDFTTDADMDPADYFFFEVAYDFTLVADAYLNVYINGVGEGAVTNDAYNEFTGGDALAKFYVGNSKSTADSDFYLDNIFVSNDPTRDMYGGGTGWCAATDVTDIYE